jgi:hypothetical protein
MVSAMYICVANYEKNMMQFYMWWLNTLLQDLFEPVNTAENVHVCKLYPRHGT